MFKWVCLGVGTAFLAVFAWLLNDLRLDVRRTGGSVRTTGETVKEHLPDIVERTRGLTDTLGKHLPEILDRIRVTTETLAELAADIRQLKELAGAANPARDKNLVAYATSVVECIEQSGGSIGLDKTFGKGLKNLVPAKEWAAGARKEALLLTILAHSKQELLTRLTKNKLGSYWYIQFGEKEPERLIDWLKKNHEPTKELGGTS